MVRRIRINALRWWRRIISLDDTPESISVSVAIGVFIAWTPTIGLQMIISFFLCWIARVNRVAGPLMAWITNPLTIVPIFYVNYVVGRAVLPGKGLHGDAYERISTAFDTLIEVGLWDYLSFNTEKLGVAFDAFWAIGAEILVPMVVGSILLGLVLGAASYPLTVRSVRAFQKRRDAKRKKWKEKLEAAQGDACSEDSRPDAGPNAGPSDKAGTPDPSSATL